MSESVELGRITTRVPARLDRLPWSHFHWLVVFGLGTVWILDGLEVTVVGAVSGVLSSGKSGVALTGSEVILAGAIYVVGACLGALFFGQPTDRFGRKKLFMITLGLYLLATGLTALSWNPIWFFVMRFFTGAGIGGEYSAINSAIDELIPAKYRGRVDLTINGSYWIGALAGAVGGYFALTYLPAFFGWRICFAFGVVLGLSVLLVRRNVPESPRWLFIHGKQDKADEIVSGIERDVEEETGRSLTEPADSITIRQRRSIGFGLIAKSVFTLYPKRSILGFSLFVGQAFLYNAIFFSYVIVLTTFFGVSNNVAPLYLVPFAIGNFLGPLLLGPLFDSVGRKVMITSTYILSGVLLLITGQLFVAGVLNAATQTAAWCVIFFFASAGASSAYLTVSEVFPMETRALCIGFFYAIGTAVGGITGPLLFSKLVASGNRYDLNTGYILGAALMIAAGIVAAFLAVKAERQTLENIAKPLTAEDTPSEDEAA
ncbi:MAG TPA: MFS transporter [Nocardioidaceae bacterium]|nr:MFS transporter [Nocardioidaceae bacterium]